MKRANKIIISVVVAFISVAIIFSISGCAQKVASNLIENEIENAAAEEGQDIDIDLEEGQVNVTDEEGNEFSVGGEEFCSENCAERAYEFMMEEQAKFDEEEENENRCGRGSHSQGSRRGQTDHPIRGSVAARIAGELS